MTLHLRPLTADDADFLREVLYHCVFVPPGETPPARDIVDAPELAPYIEGFGTRQGDIGLVALMDNTPIGAAWVRLIQGYGFVDAQTPELSIAILPGHRGSGAGTALLKGLLELLRGTFAQVSLSVQADNPASQLYLRLGFEIAADHDGAYTMLYRFAGDSGA